MATWEQVSISSFAEHKEGRDIDIDIELAVACSACSGKGKVVDFAAETVSPCEQCDSTGTRLTWTGWDLIRFVEMYRNHPDAKVLEAEDLQA